MTKIQGTTAQLRSAGAQIKVVKAALKLVVSEARMLLGEDTIHDLKDAALEVGSDVAVIENYLNDFSRMGIGSKRFLVSKK